MGVFTFQTVLIVAAILIQGYLGWVLVFKNQKE